jgi:hypothetical protein
MNRIAAACLLLSGCTCLAVRDGAGPVSSRLRAGEVDDNAAFDDYLRFFKAHPDRNVRKIDVTDRLVLRFVDPDGRPCSGARVRIEADGATVWTATASAAGEVMFPPRAVGVSPDCRRFDAVVGGRRVRVERGDRDVVVDAPQPALDAVDVDVGFCLDTTGSMQDEIDRLKATLRDVAERVSGLRPAPRLRFGLVAYRDRGDRYVTRRTPFTPVLSEFLDEIADLNAGGGDDYEESVNEGLRAAVDDLSWRDGAAIRILFLIGDAPPHLDYGDEPYTGPMRRAVERGIKIFTLAASGLDDKGEFIWRQIAQFTLAKFMFISYGGSTPHHVGRYRENNLDDLMVRAVTSEVESLRPRAAAPRPPDWGQGRAPDDFREWPGQQR